MFVFLLFSFTDFLDGFYARKLNQQTSWGATLDHCADKIFISSIFIALVFKGACHYSWAISLIARDFFVMGLREIALEYGAVIKVSVWGKLKTTFQILLIILLLGLYSLSYFLHQIVVVLFIATFIISWGSAIAYLCGLYKKLK